MKIIIILFLISFNVFAQDTDFIKYFNSFKKSALESNTLNTKYLKRLNSVKIRYAKKDEIAHFFQGYCFDKINTVVIDKDFFNQAPELLKQRAIDHELGHCVLLRSHYNLNNIKNGMEIPVTIMNASLYPYSSKKEMMIMRKDLFKAEFYGTSYEVNKKYIAGLNNLSAFAGFAVSDDFPLLRLIEHSVMEERIEKYLKKK